jgi:hypothetical protein
MRVIRSPPAQRREPGESIRSYLLLAGQRVGTCAMPLKRLIESWIIASASKERAVLTENANRGFQVVMVGGVAPWGGGGVKPIGRAVPSYGKEW